MPEPAMLVREARRAAGLTQAQLAARAGTTQSAIARLESGRTSPTVANLDRVLRAAGRQLELGTRIADVDEMQILEHLRRTPAERLRYHDRSRANTRELLAAAGRLDGGLAA